MSRRGPLDGVQFRHGSFLLAADDVGANRDRASHGDISFEELAEQRSITGDKSQRVERALLPCEEGVIGRVIKQDADVELAWQGIEAIEPYVATKATPPHAKRFRTQSKDDRTLESRGSGSSTDHRIE